MKTTFNTTEYCTLPVPNQWCLMGHARKMLFYYYLQYPDPFTVQNIFAHVQQISACFLVKAQKLHICTESLSWDTSCALRWSPWTKAGFFGLRNTCICQQKWPHWQPRVWGRGTHTWSQELWVPQENQVIKFQAFLGKVSPFLWTLPVHVVVLIKIKEHQRRL